MEDPASILTLHLPRRGKQEKKSKYPEFKFSVPTAQVAFGMNYTVWYGVVWCGAYCHDI